MDDNVVRIAISLNALSTLLESGCIHAVDFRCLDACSKKTVWRLLLSAVQRNLKGQAEDSRYV